jgi:subfamily B ATP-binding cassette protein MsbA
VTAARPGNAAFIAQLVRPYRSTLAVILAAMLLETGASLAAPWPLKFILDSVVGNHKLPAWLAHVAAPLLGDGTNKMALAAVVAAAFVVITAIGALASYIDNYYTESVGQWVANDLRLKVFAHLEHVSLSYYDTHDTGKLLSTMTEDILTIQAFASGSTLEILVDLMTIIGMVGLMFWLNFDFALIAASVTPFLLLFVMRFKGAVKSATRAVRLAQSDVVALLQQDFESMRVVKAFENQDLEETKLGAASQTTVAAALKARKVKSLLSPVVSVVVAACVAIVLWRGAGLILAGAMTVGSLTVFLAYLNKFFKPVQDLAKMTNAIAQTTVAVERVRGLLDIDAIIPDCPNPVACTSIAGALAFDNVHFAYDPTNPVLKGVSFAIEGGQKLGIVGVTGGGKSTIMSLIPRFYDPANGTVSIDGVDVRKYSLAALRNQIGYVLQDTVLFRGTIRENIAYGHPNASEQAVVDAAKVANAHDFISAMPKGYDTMVGERGLTLSGGQRQRIGIARAVIRDSPILLLDEPTAALDSESEQLVMEATNRMMKGRTVVTIAHRLATIQDADKIIVLKDGVVCESGTHAELIALGGVYAELNRVQFEQPPLAAAVPAAG